MFGELDYKNIKQYVCPKQHCQAVNVISDLRVAHFFVLFDVPHQLQNLFQNPDVYNSLLSPSEAVARSTPGIISDIWDGTVYKRFAAAVANFVSRVASCHISLDGSPLAVSSLCSIWPLQIAINELPPLIRMSNLLLGGLWFGKKPAKMDLFLGPFVSHFRTISEGFHIKVGNDVIHMRFFCIGCCCDSGARGQVQGVKSHSGYHSCNWCVIKGVWLGGAVRFPVTMVRPAERTHDALVELENRLLNNPLPAPAQEEIDLEIDEDAPDPGIPEEEREFYGVNAVSPLINLPYFQRDGIRIPSFDMVHGFFVDPMHLLDQGISKYFLTRWLSDYGHDYYIKESFDEVNRRIRSLRPPIEFRKAVRELQEKPRFSARELHNWMMFCVVPILSGILREKYLKLWLLLIQALYFLYQTNVRSENLPAADTLINMFVILTQDYYHEIDMTFNMHILKHLVAHVLRNGPLWATNAYCFEDGNGKLKQIIHSNCGIPHQIVRALSWQEAMKILEGVVSEKAKDYVTTISQPESHKQNSLKVASARLIGKTEEFKPSPEERYQFENKGHVLENLVCYPKLIVKNCTYTDDQNRSTRFDNSVAQLQDKSIIIIRRIVYDSHKNDIFLLVSDVNFETILVPPPGVYIEKDDHFMRKITSINEELKYIEWSLLHIICFRATMPSGDFVAPFPHVFNRQ